jgi:C-terminal processing protease CtpA/Prc
MTKTTTAQNKKVLPIVYEGIKSLVPIEETDTFQQVRATILEEFDDDMMPGQDFCFHVDGFRLSRKQESYKLAWSVVKGSGTDAGTVQQVVSLHPTQKRKAEEHLEDCADESNNNKQQQARYDEEALSRKITSLVTTALRAELKEPVNAQLQLEGPAPRIAVTPPASKERPAHPQNRDTPTGNTTRDLVSLETLTLPNQSHDISDLAKSMVSNAAAVMPPVASNERPHQDQNQDIGDVITRDLARSETQQSAAKQSQETLSEVPVQDSSPRYAVVTLQSNPDTSEPSSRYIRLRTSHGDLGIQLSSHDKQEFQNAFVSSIDPDGPLYGIVAVGDYIDSVDGRSLRRMCVSKVNELLERGTSMLSFVTNTKDTTTVLKSQQETRSEVPAHYALVASLDYIPGSSEASTDIRIRVSPGSLGIQFASNDKEEFKNCFLSYITPDGPLNGVVSVGDAIVSVNGENVRQMSGLQVKQILEKRALLGTRKICFISTAPQALKILNAESRPVSETETKADTVRIGVVANNETNGLDENKKDVKEWTCSSCGIDCSRSGPTAKLCRRCLASSHVSTWKFPQTPVDLPVAMTSGASTNLLAASLPTSTVLPSAIDNGSHPTTAPAPPAVDPTTTSNSKGFTVVAPPGDLGIYIELKPDLNGTFVTCVLPDSPLSGKVSVGDAIFLIDGEDVSQMKDDELIGILKRKRDIEKTLSFVRTPPKDTSLASILPFGIETSQQGGVRYQGGNFKL